MLIRNTVFTVFSIVMLVSCSKQAVDTNDNGGTTPASTILNVAYGTNSLQQMDVYLPAGRSTASTKVIIMIHGGAWSQGLGTRADVAVYVDTLKRRFPDYAIFNIGYRLFSLPNTNSFPTQELDVKSAVEFIYNKRSDYLTSDKFVLVGVSAGAHLSLLQAYKYSTPVKIKAVVDFFGPTDLNDLYTNPGVIPPLNIAAIMNGTPTTNPTLYQQSSPINFVNATAACPTIILQGSADPLVNAVRQSGALNDKLQIAGVPREYVLYNGKGHGDDWDSATFFDAFNRIEAFVRLYNP